jgi:predicted DNA-binding protein with PD1-like motif
MTTSPGFKVVALRLLPQADLKLSLANLVEEQSIQAGFILTCVGSLSRASLRLAGASQTVIFNESFEIVSLVGTLCRDGLHLHISLSREDGSTIGGHLMDGSLIRTTAELVIGDLKSYHFSRKLDSDTSYKELVTETHGGIV